MTRRLLWYYIFGVGLVGAVACTAAIFALWSFNARIRHTTESVFETVDASLVVVQDWSERAADHVRASAITTENIANGLREWTRQQIGQELARRLKIAEDSERLLLVIQHGGDWLEVSESSAKLAQEALELGNSLGAQIDTQSVDGLIEEIASLRSQLGEVKQLVETIHERAVAMVEGEAQRERVEQSIQLTLRVAATLSSFDARFSRLVDRLSDTREHVQGMHRSVAPLGRRCTRDRFW